LFPLLLLHRFPEDEDDPAQQASVLLFVKFSNLPYYLLLHENKHMTAAVPPTPPSNPTRPPAHPVEVVHFIAFIIASVSGCFLPSVDD